MSDPKTSNAPTGDEPKTKPATTSELLIDEAIKQTDLLARINEKLRHRQPEVWAQRIFWLLLNVLVVIPIGLALIYYATRHMP